MDCPKKDQHDQYISLESTICYNHIFLKLLDLINMYFDSFAKRNNHPVVRRIPNSIWNKFFPINYIEPFLIDIMQYPFATFVSIISKHDNAWPNSISEQIVFVLFVVNNPKLTKEQFIELYVLFNMSYQDILESLAILGNEALFKSKLEELEQSNNLSNPLTINPNTIFDNAAECGHLEILNILVSRLEKDHLHQIITSRGCKVLYLAGKNNHYLVLDYLTDLLQDTIEQVIATNNYQVIMRAATYGSLDLLKYFENKGGALFQKNQSEIRYMLFQDVSEQDESIVTEYLLSFADVFVLVTQNKTVRMCEFIALKEFIATKINDIEISKKTHQQLYETPYDLCDMNQQNLFQAIYQFININSYGFGKKYLPILESIPSILSGVPVIPAMSESVPVVVEAPANTIEPEPIEDKIEATKERSDSTPKVTIELQTTRNSVRMFAESKTIPLSNESEKNNCCTLF